MPNIHRVKFSSADMQSLATKTPPRSSEDQVLDFSSCVVIKPWGEEYLMFHNDFVEIWNLRIKKGEATSIHCHPNKKTGLILLEGEAEFSTLSGHLRLSPFDGVIIEAGVFHTTTALSEGGIRLIEVETPPAKHDLIRLRDRYGREDQAYEGRNKISIDNEGTIRFPDIHRGEIHEKSVENYSFFIKKIAQEELDEESLLHVSASELVILLEGLIYGPKNDEIFGVADMLCANDLLNFRATGRAFNLTLRGIKSAGGSIGTAKNGMSIFSKIIGFNRNVN